VNEGLNQIDNITQRNTANAEESAAASEELSGQAASLKKLLTLFTLEEHGAHADKQPAIKQGNDRPADFSEQYRIEDQSKGLRDESSKIISLDDFDFGKYG
jgi:methyl-accepting chemotaxis protein